MTFFLIEMEFSPPQAKQNLTVLHPVSESRWDSQTSLHDDESTDVTPREELFRNQPPCVTRLSLHWHVSGFFREVPTTGWKVLLDSLLAV